MHKKSSSQTNLSSCTDINSVNRSRVEQVLLSTVKNEIECRLQHSLHYANLYQRGEIGQSEKLKRLWDLELRIGSVTEPVSPERSILEVFENEGVGGRLLIVGRRGSGKTTMMLELAQALIQKAEADPTYPIPVIFDLPSRKSASQPISEWLVEDLKLRYGVRYKTQKHPQEGSSVRLRLLPLLDGLDEVDSTALPHHVQAINEWLQSTVSPAHLVICSQWEEFEKPGAWQPGELVRLSIGSTLLLKSLTDEQIQNYLTTPEITYIWQLLKQDKDLLKIARTSFWLNVICISHERLSLEDFQKLTLESYRLQYLLDAYVEEMLQRGFLSKARRNYKTPSNEQTKRWLSYLAKKLNRESRTEFLAEKIPIPMSCFLSVSPEGASHWETFIFCIFLIVSILSPLILLGLLFYLLFIWNRELLVLKFILVCCGLFVFNVLMMARKELRSKSIFDKLKWVGGIAIDASLGLFLRPVLEPGSVFDKVKLAVVINGLSLMGAYLWIYKLINDMFFPFTVALSKTISKPIIEYLIQPLFLLRYGYFPSSHSHFSSYCTDCFFLQRVGKRHRFIHKLLLDYFAKMGYAHKSTLFDTFFD